MKKEMRVKNLNNILRIVILVLLAVLLVYGVRCVLETRQMKAELSDAQKKVELQEQENREVGHFLENSEYYLEQQARGNGEFSDPEEDIYVVVP